MPTLTALLWLPTQSHVQVCCAAHATHELAPAKKPVFVIDPARQSMHDATFDAVEYLPAAHAVHCVAPVLVPVSVVEPGAHIVQVLSVDAVE